MEGQQAMFATGLEGINEIPTANVMQMDVQNPQMLGIVRRNIETGDIAEVNSYESQRYPIVKMMTNPTFRQCV